MKDLDIATRARHPVRPKRPSVLRKPGMLVAAGITAAAMLLPAAAAAQDVRYKSETTIEFAGALGTLMNFVPGGDETTTETVSIKDSKVRTDTKEASWVMDYATGTMLFEDHEKRTYYTLTMDQMLGMADSMAVWAERERQEAIAAEPQAKHLEDGEIGFEFELSTDGSGARDQVAGYNARQTLLTLEVEAAANQEDGESVLLGDMVMITDQWSSEEFPAAQAMKRMQEEYADEMAAMGSRAGETGSGIAAAFQYDGRFRAAVERNKEELEQLDGIPVKSTMYFVLVPPEAELDRDAVLALNDTPISEGLGSQMADMAAESAAESAKDAVKSRLGGLFGGGDDDDDDKKEEVPAPTPSVLLRATVTVTDVEETTLDAAIFGPRTGYAEEMPEHLRRMVGGES